MPWTASDAEGHNKSANTPKKRSVWAKVANEVLEKTGDDARAIKEANAAIANMTKRTAPHREFLAIQATSSGTYRVEKLSGHDYIVVPVVALVEGVIQGITADQPELALASEFGRFPGSWNGRPVTIDHPHVQGYVDPETGSPSSTPHDSSTPAEIIRVSASSTPDVLESFQVGFIFNTQVKDDTKLAMEVWLDPQKMHHHSDEAKQLLARIKRGEKVEVSTGLFTGTEEVTGTYNESPYYSVWRNVVPDHLALLPGDLIGACSIADGCGVYANSAHPEFRINRLTVNGCGCGGTCGGTCGGKQMTTPNPRSLAASDAGVAGSGSNRSDDRSSSGDQELPGSYTLDWDFDQEVTGEGSGVAAGDEDESENPEDADVIKPVGGKIAQVATDRATLLTAAFQTLAQSLGFRTNKSTSKPYGDVDYADPGYQKDKKNRYPIDTPEHIRAAWDYINQERNAGKYTPAQAAKIKSRIVAAYKAKVDPKGPPSAKKNRAPTLVEQILANSIPDGLMDTDARSQLQGALEDKHGSGSYPYLVGFTNSHAIYSRYDSSSGGGTRKNYRASYTIDPESKQAEIGDDEEAVNLTTSVDCPGDSSGMSANSSQPPLEHACAGSVRYKHYNPLTTGNKETTMSGNASGSGSPAAKVTTNTASNVTLTPEQLAAAAIILNAKANMDDDDDDDAPDGKKAKGNKGKADKEDKKDGVADNSRAPLTLEQYLASAPPELRAVLEGGMKMQAAHKANLIAQIKANSRNKFSDAALASFDQETLENLAELSIVPNYAGVASGDNLRSNVGAVNEADSGYAAAPPRLAIVSNVGNRSVTKEPGAA